MTFPQTDSIKPIRQGLVAIGEALIDAIAAVGVEDLSQATTLRLLAGGSPANLCRFVLQSGGQAQLVAAIGSDGLGKLLTRQLVAAGLNTQHVQRLNDHATSLVVVASSTSTPEFIAYRDADQYLGEIDDALLQQASVVHTTAFALSRAPARSNILRALTKAQSAGGTISIDWNYAEPIWGRENAARQVFNQIMAMRPLLKVSLDDVQRFTTAQVDVEGAKRFLAPLTTRIACLTCGAAGVWFRSEEEWHHRPAIRTRVFDATGAGDAFWAGFLTSWMQRQTTETCIQNTLATAAKRLAGAL